MHKPPIVDVVTQLHELKTWFDAYVSKYPHVTKAGETLAQLSQLLDAHSPKSFDAHAAVRWTYWQLHATASNLAQSLELKGEVPVPVIGRPPGTGWRQRMHADEARRASEPAPDRRKPLPAPKKRRAK